MRLINDTPFKPGWVVGRVPPLKLSATLMVKATFRLQNGGVAQPLPADEQTHLSGDVCLGEEPDSALVYPSDFALYKPHSDLLLTGSAHAPGGRPAHSCKVTFSIQGWTKTLLVVGNRILKENMIGGHVSDPEPFTVMPIGWDHAFGGPGHPDNPAGTGYAVVKAEDGSRIRKLPNVEDPGRLVVDPTAKHPPAGFGPIPQSAPQRMSKIGTFDKNWLKNNWPWFPADFDWTFFNAAPVDQQVKAFLTSDESVRFENLHPVHPSYTCRLPGLRLRWFIKDLAGGQPRFREIPLNLDTLWVNMDEEKMILTWRGVAPIESKKMREVENHYVVVEPLGSKPLPADHYQRLLEVRKAARKKPPPPEPPPEKPPEPGPPPDDWKVGFDARMAESEKEFKELDLMARKTEAAGIQELRAAGVDPRLLSQPSPKPNWKLLWQQEVAEYQSLMARAPEAAKAVPPPPPSDEYMKNVPEVDETPPPEAPAEEAPVEAAPPGWTRQKVEAAALAGRSLAGQDLTKLDLSGLDLSGVDLSKSILEGADLSRATLARANLSQALLPGALLKECDLSGADLGRADLTGADLTLAILKEATLDRANFSKAQLSGADLSGARAVRALFQAANLTEANLRNGDFSSAILEAAQLGKANLGGAILDNASVVKAQGRGCRFEGANLTKLHAAESEFPEALFAGVQGASSTWEEAKLDGSDFSQSVLTRANFIAASLVKASFFRADLKNATLAEAHLEGANMVQVNLFRGSLEGAHLAGADFRVSNLYEVEFLEAETNGADFRDANLKGTKLATG